MKKKYRIKFYSAYNHGHSFYKEFDSLSRIANYLNRSNKFYISVKESNLSLKEARILSYKFHSVFTKSNTSRLSLI